MPKATLRGCGTASADRGERTPGRASPPGTAKPPRQATSGVVTYGTGVVPAVTQVSVIVWYARTVSGKPGCRSGGSKPTLAPSSPPKTTTCAAPTAAAGDGAATAGRG